MKKLLTTAFLASLIASGAQAADDVTLQLKWFLRSLGLMALANPPPLASSVHW